MRKKVACNNKKPRDQRSAKFENVVVGKKTIKQSIAASNIRQSGEGPGSIAKTTEIHSEQLTESLIGPVP